MKRARGAKVSVSDSGQHRKQIKAVRNVVSDDEIASKRLTINSAILISRWESNVGMYLATGVLGCGSKR